MDFSFFYIPQEFLNAICTTLFHSLWQGFLLAAFAGLLIISTRKTSPIIRYNLLTGSLILFCLSINFTFFYQLKKENKLVGAKMAAEQTFKQIDPLLVKSIHTEAISNQLLAFLNHHAGAIVFIWFLFVLAQALKMLTGFHNLYRLRQKSIFTVGAHLQEHVTMLAKQMGIKQFVNIAESAMVKVPMVIGHLKPLILIPMGLLVALPPSAIEAILVHELAHISRRDYLINLLMSVIAIIFFFNPGVLWLVSLIREEREHCCDDIVLSRTGNKTDYIKALVACQEFNLALPSYAMAFSGKKNSLLQRVKRIISKNNSSLNGKEKSMLFLCLVVAGLLTVAFSSSKKVKRMITTHKVVTTEVTTTDAHTKANELVRKSGQHLTDSFVSITNLDYCNPDTAKCKIYLADQAKDQSNLLIPNGNDHAILLKQNGILYQINSKNNYGAINVNEPAVPISEPRKHSLIIDSLFTKKSALSKLAAIDHISTRKDDPVGPSIKYKTALSKEHSDQNDSVKVPIELPISVFAPQSIKIANQADMSEQLVKAILNEGLANSVSSFKLTASELTVNGKRIPDLAYVSFKAKNIRSIQKGTTVSYHSQTHTTTN
jgi:bla regulator protein BlaR1